VFVYSAKMDKKKLAVLIVCILVVVLALVFVFAGDKKKSDEEKARAEQIKLLTSARVTSEDDMRALIRSLGWEIADQPADSDEVRIPAEFSDVYKSYNEIQKAQGMNLEKYRGKTVKRYTFDIVNHPSGEDVKLTLLIYKEKVIGGDVCTPRLDGFMHGLLLSDAEAYSDLDIGENGNEVIASEYGENTPEDAYPTD
jgi:hypothetical protein